MNSPPAVANPSANNRLNNVTNGPAPDAVTRAGKAAKRLKASDEMYGNGLLTTPEFGAQMIFVTSRAIEGMAGNGALPPGAPAWAVAMNAALRADNAALRADNAALRADLRADLRTSVRAINDNINALAAQLHTLNARSMNAMATEYSDAIVPLPNGQGVAPNNLPQTFGDLRALKNSINTQNLLEHYGLPANPVATRNTRLCKFLGCRV